MTTAPEPSTLATLGLGSLSAGWSILRRSKAKA